MPVSIIPLLADRLDISEEKAESLLRTMLQELRRRAETDGVRLPELGTFRVEAGTLTFEPSPSLRRRVNEEYEGLSEETLSLTSTEAPVMGATEPSEEKASDDQSQEEPPPASAPSDATEASEDDVPPSPAPEPIAEDRGTDSFTLISLVLALLFVLGAGWFVLDRTNVFSPTPSDTPAVASQEPPANQSDETTPDTSTTAQADTGDTGTTGPANGATDSDTAASTDRNWTIVVASRASRAEAEAAAENYMIRFDSVEVIPGTVNDRTWYRVAVGRYATETDAERALNDQSASLPSDAWIHNLR